MELLVAGSGCKTDTESKLRQRTERDVRPIYYERYMIDMHNKIA